LFYGVVPDNEAGHRREKLDLGLSGKKAIIIGAARGIGMATAEILAREGCDLAITARSEDGVKEAVANLRKYGTKVFGSAVNVKKEDAYKAWLASAIERKTGSIVLISTTSAGEAMGGPQAYNAMKASLITWGKQLALAHGKDGIRVNVVSPGPIEFEGGNWDMLKGTMEKFYAATLRQQPSGRLGTPEEIARAIAFLASPAASWCNGSHLVVDGGFTNRTHF
jgi:NAD(P)-dependent dehydrogenase (short-subunit alcohol dehydrogenase family)